MAKWIINIALVIVLILITWFGLGPVLYADGTNTERMYTLLVVSFLYLLVFAVMFYANKKLRNKMKDK